MELMLRDGDYVPDGAGGLLQVSGREALLQRVLLRLTARRGGFVFLEDLGSRLWQLSRIGPAERQAAAEQYVAEALEEETELEVESVHLAEEACGSIDLTVELDWRGETLALTLKVG